MSRLLLLLFLCVPSMGFAEKLSFERIAPLRAHEKSKPGEYFFEDQSSFDAFRVLNLSRFGRPSKLDSDVAAINESKHLLDSKRFKELNFNFKRESVAVIILGVKGSGGYDVVVDSVAAVKDEVVVSYHVSNPCGLATTSMTYPSAVIKFKKAGKKVRFVQGDDQRCEK